MQLRVMRFLCVVVVIVMHAPAAHAEGVIHQRRQEWYELHRARINTRLDRFSTLRKAARSKKTMTEEQKASFDERILAKIEYERKRLDFLEKLNSSVERGCPHNLRHGTFECVREIDGVESYDDGSGRRFLLEIDEDRLRDIDGWRERRRARCEQELQEKRRQVVAYLVEATLTQLQFMAWRMRFVARAG